MKISGHVTIRPLFMVTDRFTGSGILSSGKETQAHLLVPCISMHFFMELRNRKMKLIFMMKLRETYVRETLAPI